jgi:hypothetical protein
MKMQMRNMSQIAVVATVGVVMALTGAVLAAPRNSELGTWKMNPAKSMTNNKGVTNTIEVAGEGVKVKVDVIRADSESHYTYTVNFDGKFSPIVGQSASGDEVSATRIDASTVSYAFKRAGKPAGTQTIVVSADGKIRTQTMGDAAGAPNGTVQVYDKQ